MVKIAVAGAAGRMGSRITALSKEYDGLKLTGAFEVKGHKDIGKDIGPIVGAGELGVKLSPDTIELFEEYRWPGNVRELENTLEGMVILGNEKEVVRQLRSKIDRPIPFSTVQVQEKTTHNGRPTVLSPSYDRRHSPKVISFDERRKQRRRRNPAMAPIDVHPVGATSLKAVSREAAQKTEQELIRKVLDQTHWNRKETAKILGISYKALLYKMKHLRARAAGEMS